MTPEQIQLVQTSFAALTGPGHELSLVERFYDQLFTDAPEARALFPDDLTEQRKKLAEALAMVVRSVTEPELLVPRLRRLGARHVGYGATADHYPVVGAALLQALAAEAGDDWTDELAAAWTAAFTVVSETMLAGAREAQDRPDRRSFVSQPHPV
jgi:nitric oxide dioxygenase